MRVIPPLTINDARLTSSTAAEPSAGETAWVSAGTYALGDLRIRTTTHRVYEALQGHTGRTALPEVDTAYWQDAGPTNRWAMFDLLRNTATLQATPLTVTLTPAKRISAIGLVGVEADAATITMTVGATTVYSHTETMTMRRTTTWSEYFFGDFRYQKSLVLFDLPPVTGAVVTISLTKAGGTVKCGGVVIGTDVYIGGVEYTARSDVLNFSKVERDAFGNATLVPRRSIPKTDQVLWIDKAQVDKLRELRVDLDAAPALWSGLDDATHGYFEALLILGVYKEFSISLDYPENAKVTLQLEEI